MNPQSVSENVRVIVNEKTNSVSVAVGEQRTAVVIATAQGPPGSPGISDVGGYPIDVKELRAGDVLIFSGVAWVNENKVTLTDGGNF